MRYLPAFLAGLFLLVASPVFAQGMSGSAPVCSALGTASGQCVQGGVVTAGGPTGSATVAPIITYNAAGQITAVTSATITPAFSSITGTPTTLSGYGITNAFPLAGGTLTANTGFYNVDASISNYASTNGVYVGGNSAGWLQLQNDGAGATSIKIRGHSYASANQIEFVGPSATSYFISSGHFLINTNTDNGWLTVHGSTYLDSTLNLTGISAATAADVLCYASSTGAVTYEPTGTTCAVSALRYKQDIVGLSSDKSLAIVLGMKPVSFQYKPQYKLGSDTHYGLVAEDVKKIAPQLVAYEPDGKQLHGVKYAELDPYLIGAIQAQEKEIAALKSQVATLLKDRKK